MRLLSVASALPRHVCSQEQILERLEREWSTRHFNLERLRRLHENVLVGGRHLALSLEEYERIVAREGTSPLGWLQRMGARLQPRVGG